MHAEDVRRTSHEHLAVSQCYGIDLYAMCYASSKMPGRESETFEARAKATCATIHRDVFDELLPLPEAGATDCSPGGLKPSRVSLEAFCA